MTSEEGRQRCAEKCLLGIKDWQQPIFTKTIDKMRAELTPHQTVRWLCQTIFADEGTENE